MSDIKLFQIKARGVGEIKNTPAPLERSLQDLFEKNLETLLGVRFLASEYATTDGRMDTLGLDENNCPVIIEYKRHSSENIINQGLFYMDWLLDHKANFELLVRDNMGKEVATQIDWSVPRLLCIASDFTRYDEHAIKQMDRTIELIRYRRFDDNLLVLELLTATTGTSSPQPTKSSSKKKPASSKPSIESINKGLKKLYDNLADFLHSLGEDVQERHLKHYTAFKRLQNFVCVVFRKDDMKVYLKLDPTKITSSAKLIRDVRKIGHYGQGDTEITIASNEDIETAKELIKRAYDNS